MIFRQFWRYLYVLVQNIRSGEFVGLGGSDTDLTRRVGRPSPGRVSSISLWNMNRELSEIQTRSFESFRLGALYPIWRL